MYKLKKTLKVVGAEEEDDDEEGACILRGVEEAVKDPPLVGEVEFRSASRHEATRATTASPARRRAGLDRRWPSIIGILRTS